MIEIVGVTKKFGSVVAVNDVSLNVMPAEIFALLGPNGAGKSTLIKIITTLMRPDQGSVTVDGSDCVRQPDLVRRSFGLVFQDPSLDGELTAWENMELHGVLYDVPKVSRRQRIEQLLKFVELWDRKDDFVKKFSGGMKRRLEIARGLVHGPKIIILDEPTLGLDPQTRHQMWSYLRQMNASAGTTVLFTTHYMDEAERIAHRIAVIDHGKIVALGTLAELKERTGTNSLEEAFLSLTGGAIRGESADPAELVRAFMRNQAGRAR